MFKVYVKDESFVEPEDIIYYLLTSTGLFLIKKSPFLRSSIKVDSIGFLQSHEESVVIFMPRIPFQTLRPVLSFFKKIYQLCQSEAETLIFYSPELKKYEISVPEQDPSATHVDYKTSIQDYVSQRKDGFCLVGDIHSHGDMGAFHSGVDSADEENFEGIHIVIGNISSVPTVSCSVVMNNKRFLLPEEDVIDYGEDFPAEWLTKVKTPKNVNRGDDKEKDKDKGKESLVDRGSRRVFFKGKTGK